jgi:predicted RNA-binding protein YlxR (DUF448 family)
MAGKHVPQRTCISCRTVRGKREFVRIVRVADDHVQADATGKKSGRGAYLCRQRECWDEALSNHHRLQQALNMEKQFSEEDLARLREVGMRMPPRSPATVETK